MESYMAGPISVKLSGIDEGHSAQHLEQNFFELVDIDFSLLWLSEQRAGAGACGRVR